MPVSAQRSVSILASETRGPPHTENFLYTRWGAGGANEQKERERKREGGGVNNTPQGEITELFLKGIILHINPR